MNYSGNNLGELLRNPQAFNGGSFKWGAHHPHCDRYSHHLIWIGGHPFCLGCTCVYIGIVIGIIATTLIPWREIQFQEWTFIHLTLLAPTILQPWIQAKIFKIFSRTLLGITSASSLLSGLFIIRSPLLGFGFRILLLLSFAAAAQLLNRLRIRYTKDPCVDCPLGSYPTCDWNLPNLLRHNTDPILKMALSEEETH